ncbi:hypothetical protein FACS1894127_1790 [Clostridia bacterium]|nr:hypothetical protein FACS1894127_1790 [Clostridia bacterium]
MLTQERADVLTEFLSSDRERAKKLLALSADEALVQINELGHDFTIVEVNEYGKALEAVVVQGGELDINVLDNVAGGIVFTTGALIGLGIFAARCVIGWTFVK